MYVHARFTGWRSLAFAALLAATGPAGAQIFDTIPTDTPNSGPTATKTAPDGSVWFVEQAGDRIGQLNPARTDVSEVNLTIPNSQPTDLAIDRSGQVWFCEAGTSRIGLYNPFSGSLVEYSWGVSGVRLAGIAIDGQGRIWFTENATNRIGLLDPNALTLQYYAWTSEDIGPLGITTDAYGRVWFTENRSSRIGVLDPFYNYVYDYYYAGYASAPFGITVDADQDVWFTEQASGAFDRLDVSTGQMFQFNTIGGFGSQPKYIDTQQTSQGDTLVAWAESAPGNGRIGILDANTGAQSQIQASNPNAGPTGVTFAPDSSLWWTEYNTSALTGSYYSPGLVRARPGGGPILASLDTSLVGHPVLATLGSKDDSRIILVKKDGKDKHGNKKQPKVVKSQAKVTKLAVNRGAATNPPKKSKKTNKGRQG